MTSIDSRLSTWKPTGKDAALNNINHFLARAADQTPGTTRRQRVVKDLGAQNGGKFNSLLGTERKVSDNARGSLIDTDSGVSSQVSEQESYQTAFSQGASQAEAPHLKAQASLRTPSKNGKTDVPPHLRRRPMTPGSCSSSKKELIASIHAYSEAVPRGAIDTPPTKATQEEPASPQRMYPTPPPEQTQVSHQEQNGEDVSPPRTTSLSMNSGTAAKSAKTDSPFPCAYADCTMGFREKEDLDEHKYLEHEGWCKRCDIDTEDNTTLLAHKMSSLRHIACQFCGIDFHTERARDNHERLVHCHSSVFPFHEFMLMVIRNMGLSRT